MKEYKLSLSEILTRSFTGVSLIVISSWGIYSSKKNGVFTITESDNKTTIFFLGALSIVFSVLFISFGITFILMVWNWRLTVDNNNIKLRSGLHNWGIPIAYIKSYKFVRSDTERWVILRSKNGIKKKIRLFFIDSDIFIEWLEANFDEES